MKKRITLLGIIVAVLSFLNIGSVSAYNPSQFDLVPEPVYNLLRKILIEFGMGPGESFIVFAKFVLFVILFALFYYGSFKFFKQQRICTVISLGLSLFSVILLPGTYVLKMAELYAGIAGIMLPVLLIWLGFKMYKNFSHPVMKGIIDALSIMIVSSTMAAVQGGSDLPFLFETVKWFGLLQLFFMFMLVIHILEAFSWAAGQMGEGGSGGGSSLWDKVFGGGGDSSDSSTPAGKKAAATEHALEKKEEADIRRSESLIKMEEKLQNEVHKGVVELESAEMIEMVHIKSLKRMCAAMITEARRLKYVKDKEEFNKGYTYLSHAFQAFDKAVAYKSGLTLSMRPWAPTGGLIANFKKKSMLFKKVIKFEGKGFDLEKDLDREIRKAELLFEKVEALQTRNLGPVHHPDTHADMALLARLHTNIKNRNLPFMRNTAVTFIEDYKRELRVVEPEIEAVTKGVDVIGAYFIPFRFDYKTSWAYWYSIIDRIILGLIAVQGRLDVIILNYVKSFEDLKTHRIRIEKEMQEFQKEYKQLVTVYARLRKREQAGHPI